MIRRADTMGVFQIESRAQMSMLPRLRPRCFYDLVIEVAIVRPGPIQGEMVHPYLRRRAGLETVSYPNDEIRAVLEKTLGVPLFQEQAMRLAVVAAGFTPGEADQLRRAMAAWRRPGLIDEFRQKLIRGMTANGLSPAYAESVFRQIRGFGEYGFPESHSASFALLVYVSAWLKCHAMAAFTAGVLNSQPMGFYAPAQLVRNAREHGVEVRGPDVNRSDWDCTLEEEEKEKGLAIGHCKLAIANCGVGEAGEEREECKVKNTKCKGQSGGSNRGESDSSICNDQFAVTNGQSSFRPLALRLGLRMLGGLGEAQARRIEAARRPGGPFRSMEDFVRRTGLGRAVAVRLAKAGAMESLGLDRRGALWHALAQDQKPLPLLDQLETRPDERPENLPAMSAAEEVLADYRTAGLSLRAHPLSFLRADLARRRVTPAGELKHVADGRPVRVAGIVLVRQRPGTAKGITFVTLEDETGQANLIIRPDVWGKFRQAAIGATLLLVHGRLQRQSDVTHILVSRIEDYSDHWRELGSQSRDFC
jgi:error-prone DNA polymerase